MPARTPAAESLLEKTIFASRWLQAPLYVGLIVAQGVYVWQFMLELWHLLHAAFHHVPGAPELGTQIMLGVLGLIDVVMIANLLVMVIIGGYETFVSRLHLDDHTDQPEWLDHVNAGTLKVKLASALVSISSIHLLKTFIGIGAHGITPQIAFNDKAVLWQVIIHFVFLISALILAWTDRVMMGGSHKAPAPSAH